MQEIFVHYYNRTLSENKKRASTVTSTDSLNDSTQDSLSGLRCGSMPFINFHRLLDESNPKLATGNILDYKPFQCLSPIESGNPTRLFPSIPVEVIRTFINHPFGASGFYTEILPASDSGGLVISTHLLHLECSRFPLKLTESLVRFN